jgi:hypothetical protein
MTIGPPVLVALARGELDVARSVIDGFDRQQAESGAAFESDYRSVRTVALAHVERQPQRALAAILDAGSGDYAEWPAWLPFAVDVLVEGQDDRPLRAAMEALRRPVAPKTSPHVNAQVQRLAAHLAARGGDWNAAAVHWQRARQITSEAGIPFDAAVLALELAEEAPDGEAAPEATRAEAIATFERLHAEPWLERARLVAARIVR